MNRYQAMVQERAELVAEGEALFAAAERENRALTEAERTRDDEISARLKVLSGDIAREEERRERLRTVDGAPEATAGAPAAVAGARISGLRDRREDDARHGWAGIGEFALAVRDAARPGAGLDERLRIGAAPSNYLERGGTSGEGFLVPPEFRQAIWDIVFDDPVVERFNFEPTSSGQVQLLADETTPWGSTGVVAYWRAEAGQMTASKPGVKERFTRTHQLYAFVLATEELLRDAPLLNDRITRKAADAITWKVAEALVRGTGAGQPLGILTHTAKVEVAKESGQAADTIVTANVLKMYARVLKGGGPLFWLANDDVVPQLATMTIGNQPAWLAPSALMAAPGGSLLGLPIYYSEHCDTVGDVGDLILCNAAGYHAIRRTEAPQFASSIHLYFDYNIQAFRWIFEVGGQPFLEAVITPPNSSNTKAHFVTLADRA